RDRWARGQLRLGLVAQSGREGRGRLARRIRRVLEEQSQREGRLAEHAGDGHDIARPGAGAQHRVPTLEELAPVTAIVRVGETERSPPTMPQPGASSSQASRKPSAIPSSNDTGESAGAAIATTRAVGTAPIAATSERLEAAAFQPRSCGVDQA